jgi:myo-inositol 2-dehydrogenase/D-chiro-inositol 1-dehydrogenase
MPGVIVALIGAGNIGSLHAASLAGEDAVEQLLIADADPARARTLAERVGGRAVTPAEAFASAPDAVVIAAATDAHGALVRRCIELGIAAFCEKPLSAGVDESVALVELAEAVGASPVQVGFMRRFDPALIALRERYRSGALGRVHVVRVASHDHEPPSEEYAARSGGIFRDQLIHDFDMVRWVSGSEVEWVYAAGAIHTLEFLAALGDVDTCALTLGLAGGELVALTGSREDGRGEDVRIEAIGSADSASAGFNARTPLLLLDPLGVSAGHQPYGGAFDRFAAAYAAEIAHFLELAQGRAENPCPPRDALATLLVAVAAERSLASDARVRVQRADELLSRGGARETSA